MIRPALILALLVLPATALAKDDKKNAPVSPYVEMQSLTATCLRADHTRGVVTVDNGLDIPDATLRTLAIASEPRLRAAYNQFLGGYMIGLPGGAPPNADYMESQLQRLTDQILGKPGARFLIGSILMN